jgi:glycine/D-amino acid oxidase-like deaminating enzyme
MVLGRGIAGAVLAETLLQRGLRVHVFDSKRPGNASMAAAGVVNPVVLKRDVPSWRAAELLPLAEAFYTAMETRLATRFWHPVELVKLFPGEREAAQWERAMRMPDTASFIDRRSQPQVDVAPLLAHEGHGTVHGSAWLDVPAMLEAQRQRLLLQGMLSERDVAEADIEQGGSGVRIGAYSAPWLVRCTGPFATLPGMVPVKGEGITARLPGLRVDRMLHRGVFLLPKGAEDYRVGATFKWDKVWEGPTDEAREWLLEKLGKLTPVRPEVLDHWAGVRPTSADRRPIMGKLSAHEAVLNGLGARGVLLAPWCAAHLADHLFEGEPLEDEVRSERSFARP